MNDCKIWRYKNRTPHIHTMYCNELDIQNDPSDEITCAYWLLISTDMQNSSNMSETIEGGVGGEGQAGLSHAIRK
jgi:hypothetical protein